MRLLAPVVIGLGVALGYVAATACSDPGRPAFADQKEHVAKKRVRIVYGVYQLATGKVGWLEEK